MSHDESPPALQGEGSRENPFALWRFLVIGTSAALVCWTVQFYLWMLGIVPDTESSIGFVLVGLFVGLIASALWYLELMRRSLGGLRLSPEELAPTEEILLATTQSMVSLPGGVLSACGGKLFLTNRRLVFKPHGGQFGARPLWFPLAEIDHAEVFLVQGCLPSGIRIRTKDGREERFNLGMVNQPKAEDWVMRILVERAYLLSETPASAAQESSELIQKRPIP